MYKSLRKISALVFIFAALFSFTEAVKLQAVKLPSLKEVNFLYDKNTGMINGSFVVQNPSSKALKYKLILSFVSPENGKEYTRIEAKTDKDMLPPLNTLKSSFKISNVYFPRGSYDVIFILDLPGFGPSSLKKAGTLHISTSDTKAAKSLLSCQALKSISANSIKMNCVLDPLPDLDKDIEFKYEINFLGDDTLRSANIIKVSADKIKKDGIELTLPFKTDRGGPVDIKLQANIDGALTNIAFVRYMMPGSYSKVLNIDVDRDLKQLDIYLTGTYYSKDRRLLVGMTEGGEVCFMADYDLYALAPIRRYVSYKDSECSNASRPFAVIYKNNSELNASHIISFYGLANRETALALLRNYKKTFDKPGMQNFEFKTEYMAAAIALFAALVLIVAIVFLRRKSNSNVMPILFLFVFIFGINSSFAHAEIFDSLDAPKVRFEVNFPTITKEVGQNDNIVFSFSAIDNFSGGISKYPGVEAYVWIDNATTTQVQIMQATDTSPTVLVSLPHTLSVGKHTLNFFIPASSNVCGSAFDFSDFDTAVFDPQPCEFQVDFTVVPGSVLQLTFYAQPKAVPKGSTSKLYWFSAAASSCVASGGPWSGSKPLNNTTGEVTPPINDDAVTFALTCSNSTNSVTRDDTVYTYVCGDGFCSQWESCDLCSADCGTCATAQDILITADPMLVRAGGVSYITWKATGFTSCTVTEDNPTINDSWTRLAGVEKTSPLNADTTYTATCTDGSTTKSKSVKVRIIPKWVEF